MAKPTKNLYVVVQNRAADSVSRHLAIRTKCIVSNLGYTDSSTTTQVLRLRTSRPASALRKIIWEVFLEADVREVDPQEE